MTGSQPYRFVREELRRMHFRYTRSGLVLLALAGLALWYGGALRGVEARWGLAAAALILACVWWYERRIEARFWRMHDSASMWFDDGRVHWADRDHEVSEPVAQFVRVRPYTMRGRLFLLQAELADGSVRHYLGLDDMPSFLAELRRHAPQATFGPTHNHWL